MNRISINKTLPVSISLDVAMFLELLLQRNIFDYWGLKYLCYATIVQLHCIKGMLYSFYIFIILHLLSNDILERCQ